MAIIGNTPYFQTNLIFPVKLQADLDTSLALWIRLGLLFGDLSMVPFPYRIQGLSLDPVVLEATHCWLHSISYSMCHYIIFHPILWFLSIDSIGIQWYPTIQQQKRLVLYHVLGAFGAEDVVRSQDVEFIATRLSLVPMAGPGRTFMLGELANDLSKRGDHYVYPLVMSK